SVLEYPIFKPCREKLDTYVEVIEQKIKRNVKSIQEEKPATRIPLSQEVMEIFEKLRRGKR
ncbi:hypothetical protein FO478_05135, partial [Heyndrickxia coagulans DSM 1 = ATCC 7050]|nr:hypothetical protein [Heyndrickxia coagulans DSM 1 = ATCC 7050]